jgi:hypothetical protein
VTDEYDTDTPLPPPATGDEGDITPIPPPAPDERDSLSELGSVAEEDRAARAAANIPRARSGSEAAATPPRAPDPAAFEPTATVPPIRPPDVWDRTGAWLVEHGSLPALAIISIAGAVIHGRIFFGESAGDDRAVHDAVAAGLSDCVAHGDVDFGHPSAEAGYASR